MHFLQIIMHALQCQHDLDVHLLFCVDINLHITSFRGCVYGWVPLRVHRLAKAMPFQQLIMHALQCQHDLDVHQ